jgi:anti-sigma regulatory factor (Ser/Thr protein kinase)
MKGSGYSCAPARGDETVTQLETELHLPGANSIAPSLGRAGMAATANSLTPATADALALLTSELVTNAVNHAGMTATEDILLRLLDGSRLRVEVVDSGPGFDPPNAWTDGERIHGWGLLLVDRLAAAWGVEPEGSRNKDWFELDR